MSHSFYLQKKYNFDDRRILKATVLKKIVKKKEHYLKFHVIPLGTDLEEIEKQRKLEQEDKTKLLVIENLTKQLEKLSLENSIIQDKINKQESCTIM